MLCSVCSDRKEPGAAEIIAEYERALQAGELDGSQQQSPSANPGAAARASQQSQQAPDSLPAIPEAASQQLQNGTSAPAGQPQRQAQQQQQQQQQQKRRDPRLRRKQLAAHVPDAGQAANRQPDQQAAALPAATARRPAAPANQQCNRDAAVAGAGQDPTPSHDQSQPPTDSQWLALETQTQAPGLDAPVAMDWVPFTQVGVAVLLLHAAPCSFTAAPAYLCVKCL